MADAESQFDLELEETEDPEPDDPPSLHINTDKASPTSPVFPQSSGPTGSTSASSRGHFRSRSISHDGNNAFSASSPPFAHSPGSQHAGLMDYRHHRPSSLGTSPAMASPGLSTSPRPGLTLPPPSISPSLAEADTPAPWVHPPRAGSISPPLFPFSMPPVSPTLLAMSPNPLEGEDGSSPARRKLAELTTDMMLPQPMHGSPAHSRKRSFESSPYFGPSSPSTPSPPRINGFHPSPAVPVPPTASTSAANGSLLGTPTQGVIALRRRASIDSNNQPRARQRTLSPGRPRSVSPKRTGSGGSTSSQGSDSDSSPGSAPAATLRKSPKVSPSSTALRHSFSDEGIAQPVVSAHSAKRSPSFEDVAGSSMNDSPPSPMALLPMRGRSAHLAMPPPSGWELSDDVDESGSDASGSAGGSDKDEMEEDQDAEGEEEPGWESQKRLRSRSGEPIRRHHRRTPSGGSIEDEAVSPDAANGATEEDEDEHEPWGPLVEANRRPDQMDQSADGAAEQLTMLEHIFIFSKSEWREHRVIVSRSLADWMEDLDICETLEFVFPLLTALASDDDEVKLGLSTNLDRIMWYFYSRCPLVELSPPEQESGMDVDAPDNESKRPRLSATAFVPLLGLLLMEPHGGVTHAARMAVVRFLCRINDQPIPHLVRNSDEDPEQTAEINAAANTLKSPIHTHEGYLFDREAKMFLEAQLLSDVVLGLAHLESEDDPATPMEGVRSVVNGTSHISDDDDDDDEWSEDDTFEPSQRKAILKRASAEASPDWGEPLHRISGSTVLERDDGNTSRDSDEITSGKIAALELSSAIAAHPLCLSTHNLESQVLSETVRLASDGHTGVRSASAAALGHLAGALPEEIVISQVLPPFEALAADPDVEVRKATCFALAFFVTTLSPDVRRARILWAVKRFANDSQRAVRIALAQLSGQLFHALHLVGASIPSELVDFYLGRDLPPPAPAESDKSSSSEKQLFAPLQTALSGPPDLPPASSEPSDFLVRLSKQPPDTERNQIIAFNLPAVILSIGGRRWDELRQLHLDLAQDPDETVRKSIAASLHEVAKIIGPEAAVQDIAPLFERFVTDFHVPVRSAALASATDLVAALPTAAGRRLLSSYIQAMFPPSVEVDPSESMAAAAAKWREREQAAQALHVLASQYARDEPSESPFYGVLARLVRDPAASVRLAAIDAIPDIYLSLLEHADARSRLVGWLISTLARDSPCRSRCIFVSIVRAIAASAGPTPRMVEADFLSTLTQLAHDAVLDVRIAVAREAAVLRRTLFQDEPPVALLKAIESLAADASPTVRSYVSAPAPTMPRRRSPSVELDEEDMLEAVVDDELSASAIRDLDDGFTMGTSPPR